MSFSNNQTRKKSKRLKKSGVSVKCLFSNFVLKDIFYWVRFVAIWLHVSHSTAWFRNFDPIFQEKKEIKAAIFIVKLMLQFLALVETISFHIFVVGRSLWRSIYHQILQRQVAFHALSKSGKLSYCRCSIILTSFAINLQIQYYKLSMANLIHSDILFCFRDLFWTVIPKDTNKLKNCLQVRFLRLGLVGSVPGVTMIIYC